MSRGPGKIERAIAALLDGNPDMAVTTEELAERVYGVGTVEKKHTVSLLRALRRLAQRRPDIGKTWDRDWQRHYKRARNTVWFNRRNVQSYGMMMLKTRYCAYRISESEKQFSHIGRIPKVETEAELLAMMAAGGKYHSYVQPGGDWYRAVHGVAEAPEAPAAELGLAAVYTVLRTRALQTGGAKVRPRGRTGSGGTIITGRYNSLRGATNGRR